MRLTVLAVFMALCATAQERFSGSDDLDRAIEEAIAADQLPGAVLWIGQGDRILHRKAYGSRSLVPEREPMTVDTVFDAASLTKVVATTASVMKLFEQGKIRLNDPVTNYLPAFQHGKSDITIRQLLTHFSGLRPDVDLKPEWDGYQTGVERALIDVPIASPGERFIYSDINFVLLGEIVRVLSGKRLDDYAQAEIFGPLGMSDSRFNPELALRPRIAPTELYPTLPDPLRGIVHDPTARYMQGVAGHAGLFTTASDLSKFARMILNKGELEGKRIVNPLTIHKFTEPQTPGDQPVLRGLGFDIDSQFSGNRGELYPIGSVGHTGFTGTSLWIDAATKSYVILMANSVHPIRRPAVTSLRGRVATVAAASLGIDLPGVSLTGYNETLSSAGLRRMAPRNGATETGLDVLVKENFRRLKGKRVGLITNHTGLTRTGLRNIDAMTAAGVKLAAIYAPEHGILGKEDREGITDTKDPKTGVKVWSLYKDPARRPSAQMLQGVDVLVFDIQDVGVRFYTYVSTMRNCMEEASKRRLPFIVLDRPNPITGVKVEGPVLRSGLESFIGIHTLALRHGMTAGELARLFHDELKLTGPLEVVKMRGWERGDWFDSTGLMWLDLSPNMRSLNAALLYSGIGMLEYSKNYSVGRGTGIPFEQVGAEFIKGIELAAYLNGRRIPGIRFYATRFTPEDSNLKDKPLEGVRFVITNREALNSSRVGLEIAAALVKLYPNKIDLSVNKTLIGNQETIDGLAAGEDPRALQDRQDEELKGFLERRAKYLLYK